MTRTQSQIDEQIELTFEKDFSGMSYAEGVRQALEWVTGETDIEPMED